MDPGSREKTVLVTGATGGIGSACARAFSREGARLVLPFHSKEEMVELLNAGIWVEKGVPLERMELSQWRETLAANLDSAFLCCRAFLRHLAEAPRATASIVAVASTAAL